MLSWPAYKENSLCIKRVLNTLRDALRRYKERRLKDGYFYLVPARQQYAMSVRSPLFTMPRKEAMKKIKLLRQKREAVSCAGNASPVSEGSTPRHMHKVLEMMLIYGCTIGLAYIIIRV
ncbi:hypothetical protein HU200_011982 [Digitaria exilis]|uniref:Uncharacterized protein n=1 Tax=Digitaria exilis TaxID=1010633 RepID=A0A835FG91_9POAL|nr:hypothetical protein HU200_032797 [Digitaria exilis]KAF8751996.1 hypothetical protein HU200_011982 [Digitaria exilis]